jgi:hypothetical protein
VNRRPRGRAILAACIVFCAQRGASGAEPPTQEADALFDEGRRLLDAGRLPEACGKLERSFQLAPRLGTMLNLGACYELRGQLAHALAIYERAATLARQQGRADREKIALDYAAALESRVGKLVVVTEETSPELVTQVDAETISTRSGLVPLDPGHRRLVARVPGHVPFETTVEIVAGKNTTVKIPRLALEARSEAGGSGAYKPPPASEGSTRTWILASGLGLTVVSAGVGTFFGLRAKAKKDESQCDATGCTPDGLATYNDARTAGTISTTAFVVAGVSLVATLAGLLFFPREHAVPTK